MNLKALLTRFAADESGAVTVDWVVLTAGLVGLAAIVGTTVVTGVDTAAKKVNSNMATEGETWTLTP